MSRPALVFVVGTGRCGSTLISNILREHPDVVSLSEFFLHLTDLMRLPDRPFPVGPVTGAELWRLLTTPTPTDTLLLRHGIAPPEVRYPFDSSTRYGTDTGVPPIALTALPGLTDEPDKLLDELADVVPGWPSRPAEQHYRALFGWLCERFDARVCVERSGTSLRLVRLLRQRFPDARFIHLIRDGRDCALSMSRHTYFKMAFLLIRLGLETGADPFGVPQTAAAPAAMRGLTPRDFDARAFQQSVLSPVLCGQYWSGEIERGLAALAGADVLHIWYEDLLRQPVASIGRIVAFITGEAKPGFVAAAASIVRAPRSTWRELPEDEAWLLESVCQAGYAALARYGIAPTVVGNPR